jgi:TnpA family transposase
VLAAVQVLPELARRRVAQKPLAPTEIATQWPEMLRVAGSLVTNQVRGYDLLRMFGRDGHPTPLGHAHLNCLGRYAFTRNPPSGLRPLRDPSAPADSDEGW